MTIGVPRACLHLSWLKNELDSSGKQRRLPGLPWVNRTASSREWVRWSRAGEPRPNSFWKESQRTPIGLPSLRSGARSEKRSAPHIPHASVLLESCIHVDTVAPVRSICLSWLGVIGANSLAQGRLGSSSNPHLLCRTLPPSTHAANEA
jgi:hypothetical protein